MRIAAIDVGLQGGIAIAAFDRNNPVDSVVYEFVMPMPVVANTRHNNLMAFPDVQMIRKVLHEREVGYCIVEFQQAMSKNYRPQGVSSTALLMRQFGLCEGISVGLGLRTQLVMPKAWKRVHGLERGTKEQSRERAISLFPDLCHRFGRKQDHGPAEAALIAWWKVNHAADNDEPVIRS